MASLIETIDSVRFGVYNWRRQASIPARLGLILLGTVLMGLAAQIRVPLPWTPIPITGATFGVMALGAVLGAETGAASILLYLLLGAAGMPWFAMSGSGWAYLAGPTAGYLVGFILAVYAIGFIYDRFSWARRLPGLLALLFMADFVLIFGCGMLWFGYLTGTWGIGLLAASLLPFIPGEAVKILAATAAARSLPPPQQETL
jgi:biotin transport system substrate-specific component